MTAREPRTEAGRRLLQFWQLHRSAVHGVNEQVEPSAIAEDILAIEDEAGAGSGEAAGLRAALRTIVDVEDVVDASWRDTSRGLFVEQLQELNETRRTAIDRARALLAAPAAPTGAASTGLDVERLAKALELIGDDPYGCKWADEGRGHHGHAFAVALAAEYDRLAAPAPETAAADR